MSGAREAIKALIEILNAYKELRSAITAPIDEALKPLKETLRDAISDALYRQLTDLGIGRETPLSALASKPELLMNNEALSDPLSILYPGLKKPDMEDLRKRIYSHFEKPER